MSDVLKVISPVDGSIYAERPLATWAEVDGALSAASAAQAAWKFVPLAERASLCLRFVEAFLGMKDEIVPELAWQMGRPIAYGAGELRGFEERARYMVSIAEEALADIDAGPKEGFRRWVRREPLGVVLAVAAWNYPYLIAVNSVVPAIMAGNAVILRGGSESFHSSGAIHACLVEGLKAAGLPEAAIQLVPTRDRAAGSEMLAERNASGRPSFWRCFRDVRIYARRIARFISAMLVSSGRRMLGAGNQPLMGDNSQILSSQHQYKIL